MSHRPLPPPGTPIEVPRYGGDGTATVPLATLVAWKHAIRLESLGMTRSGPSATSLARKALGFPRGYPRENVVAFLAAVVEEVADIHAAEPAA